jgi:glycerol uptake facilitator-like aquaporin
MNDPHVFIISSLTFFFFIFFYTTLLLGGHINPAVTFALMLTGDVSMATGLLYFVAQFLGAMLGAAILWGCTASQLLMETTAGNDGTTGTSCCCCGCCQT